MAAGSGATVIVAEPVIPSTVAEMVALPAATADTEPVAETVATAGALLLHVTARPVSAAPAASRAVAASACTPPTTREAVAGVTTTEATGEAVTVMGTFAVAVAAAKVADPVAVAVTVMVVVPGATAETTPALDTVATLGMVVP
jgi:hypothetical protein